MSSSVALADTPRIWAIRGAELAVVTDPLLVKRGLVLA